ncbi:hypothetical protein J437_LFUL019332 [Ladona fulva]|uniref:Uncharacterized protein n=1 Tax=Ladona fulva TaxID=123851 RepID=A0A8K0PCC2_LADFU|nr:hypothetical protein J437_LFUL019332 [Ladona fulva]
MDSLLAKVNMPIRPLPKDLQEKAKEQLSEDPKRLENDLQYIKDWLKKQPHIKPRMDCVLCLAAAEDKSDFLVAPLSPLDDDEDQEAGEAGDAGVSGPLLPVEAVP